MTTIQQRRAADRTARAVPEALPEPFTARSLDIVAPLDDLSALLALASRRFEGLFQGLPVACVCFDSNGRVYEWNRAFTSLVGLPGEKIMQRTLRETLGRPEGDRTTQRLVERVFAGECLEGQPWEVARRDGHVTFLLCNAFPLRDEAGGVIGGIAAFVDITAQKRAEQQLHDHNTRIQEQMQQIEDYNFVLEFQKVELEKANLELEQMATLDGLTGLKNHRSFQEQLADEFARAVRYGSELSLLLLDIDRFKEYNDTFGHPGGDEVIRQVASLLKKATRESDYVARYGGEEFAILLPHTDAAGARAFAERVRSGVEDACWIKRSITVSVGAATLSPAVLHPAILVADADKALYCAKAMGRNGIIHSGNLSLDFAA